MEIINRIIENVSNDPSSAWKLILILALAGVALIVDNLPQKKDR